jgi:hypothetical protein
MPLTSYLDLVKSILVEIYMPYFVRYKLFNGDWIWRRLLSSYPAPGKNTGYNGKGSNPTDKNINIRSKIFDVGNYFEKYAPPLFPSLAEHLQLFPFINRDPEMSFMAILIEK